MYILLGVAAGHFYQEAELKREEILSGMVILRIDHIYFLQYSVVIIRPR